MKSLLKEQARLEKMLNKISSYDTGRSPTLPGFKDKGGKEDCGYLKELKTISYNLDKKLQNFRKDQPTKKGGNIK